MKRRRRLQFNYETTLAPVVVVVVLLMGLATYILLGVVASGAFASIALSNASVSGLNIGSDPAAFGGHYIQFGSGATPTPTPTPAPTPTPTSTPGGQAGQGAGIVAGTSLSVHSGDLVITGPGTWSNLHVTGDLLIAGSGSTAAKNVTVSNVLVDGTVLVNYGANGEMYAPVPSNITMSHIEGSALYTRGFSSLHMDHAYIHGGGTSSLSQVASYTSTYPASDFVLTDSKFVGEWQTSTVHKEALHLMGVAGVDIERTIFDARTPDPSAYHISAAFFMEPAFQGIYNTNVLFTGNELHGGGYYQAYFYGKSMTISNNAFNADWSLYSGAQYPPSQYQSSLQPYPQFTQSGNTLDGKPYTLLEG